MPSRKRTPASRAINPGIFHLDVRPVIARNEDPLELITALVSRLGPGQALAVQAPFIPSPLIERLRAEGFGTAIEHREDRSWVVTFTKEGA